ncbi:hypothetical protein BKI52_37705 [marine bacterium AO1-C]|nr:hypothetical protein BKI52_37705 [marine bacterium AO1-C]
MNTQKFDKVSGLFLFSEYFSNTQCQDIIQKTLALYEKLEEGYSGQHLQEAHIPQPEFVRSAQHNLSSEESFVKVNLAESNQRNLRCEYFPRYGEDGHALAYFRGNANLPDFIDEEFLTSLTQNLINVGITPPEGRTQWKLTVNYYKSIADSVAGFPFHVDIPSNGVVTMIMNVQREAQFQIAKDEQMEEITIPVGGLLILSGESRYEWKHRVLPMQSAGSISSDNIERVSLVLGFK